MKMGYWNLTGTTLPNYHQVLQQVHIVKEVDRLGSVSFVFATMFSMDELST